MESNMFTDEQLEILRKGFQKHDFTQTVPLNMSYEDMTPKQAAAFVALKTRIMEYAKANLPAPDIKRKIGNFSGDFPVNLLLEADSTYIDVFETEGVGKNRTQRVEIFYRFVGYIVIPDDYFCGNYVANTRQGVAVEYIPTMSA